MDTAAAAALEQRAIDFAKRGDFGSHARSVNEELASLAPANQGAWTRLARCCLELGQLDAATAALDSALQLNPQNTIARNLQIEVTTRRAGPAAAAAPRKRTSRPAAGGTSRTASPTRVAASRSATKGTMALAGIGRAEFTALGLLPPEGAAESLTARIEPLLMALNERPFAAKIVEARNRAGQGGVRLFRRGSIEPGSPGHIHVYQQGGRWEPQVDIGLFARTHWGRDCLSAGIGFTLADGGDDDRSGAGRERVLEYFQAFQGEIASTWRVHLTDWLRTRGGFIQYGTNPPATELLPNDAVSFLIHVQNPAELGRAFCGRWLFADRGEDVGILTEAPRLLRWIEETITDLLPLWGTVYREAYRSRGTSARPGT